MAEYLPSKQIVVGSSPIPRSKFNASENVSSSCRYSQQSKKWNNWFKSNRWHQFKYCSLV